MLYMPTSPFTQKLQHGGRIPEVVITLRRKTISTSSQGLQQCFRASPIQFHGYRHCWTLEKSIACKPEVKTVSQTGSTNNLAQKQITTQCQWLYLCFGEQIFSLVYNADLNRRFLRPEIPRWRTYTGSSYNSATDNNIRVIFAAGAMFYVCVATEIASISVSIAN